MFGHVFHQYEEFSQRASLPLDPVHFLFLFVFQEVNQTYRNVRQCRQIMVHVAQASCIEMEAHHKCYPGRH